MAKEGCIYKCSISSLIDIWHNSTSCISIICHSNVHSSCKNGKNTKYLYSFRNDELLEGKNVTCDFVCNVIAEVYPDLE